MSSYGQFCPIAKAMEVLDERWTLLVVRELLLGSRHFNELRRGNPKMSPALLSKRLRRLERAGVVRRRVVGGRSTYELTESGLELRGVVDALGAWGARWVGDLGEEDLDPHLLLWDVRRTLPVEDWPRGRTVVAMRFGDVAPTVSRWWICVLGDEVDICDVDPGFEVVATVHTSLRTMTEIWRGDRGWGDAIRAGRVEVDAPTEVARAVPGWIGQSLLASVPRPA
ncbi:MAG TPA: helix-turn-helix domain-containing protein [Ornithinibacter sp.]|nr:helix-turn-helix domain-containing protein [Ornithinibacter sp.]